MKKDLLTHFSFLISIFIFISIYRGWLALEYLPFWYGGILGTLLPYADYLIYIYLVKPKEQISQQTAALISEKKVVQTWDVLIETRNQKSDLIFHTSYFQLIFLAFSFLIITSTTDLLGRGLVLAFLLHLLVDQFVDYVENKNLDSWFGKYIEISDNEKRLWYLFGNFAALLFLGFIF